MFFTDRLTMDYISYHRTKAIEGEGSEAGGDDDCHDQGGDKRKQEQGCPAQAHGHGHGHGGFLLEVIAAQAAQKHSHRQPSRGVPGARGGDADSVASDDDAAGASTSAVSLCIPASPASSAAAAAAAATAAAAAAAALAASAAATPRTPATGAGGARGAYANAVLLEFSVMVHSVVIGLGVGLDSSRSLINLIIFTMCGTANALYRALIASL